MDYNNVEKFSFMYDYSNRLARVTNEAENYTTDYTYDLSGRLIEKNRSDGAYVKTSYNEKNLATGVNYSFGGLTESVSYSYNENKDNAPAIATLSDGSLSVIRYDNLGRVTENNIHNSEAYTSVVHTNYSYTDKATDTTKTSGLVSEMTYSNANIRDAAYTYDALGNIKLITYNKGIAYERFSYDKLNRLVRVDSEITGDTVVYTYDDSGNIKKKDVYYCGVYNSDLSSKVKKYTVNYTYDNSSWGDLLTAYNGTAITYDAIGNPLTYGDNSFTWNGRRMATFSDGTTTSSYKYNEDGVRTSKTVDGTKTEFFVDGTTILAQKTGNKTTAFNYDANGKRIAFKYDGDLYFYVYNLQGDVTHILDFNGDIVGKYEYDAWGNITYINGTIAQINPFRYRGYYYDTESGLYYLNSRYYNPEWGRFINADGEISGVGGSIQGYNLFAYCMNNPVNLSDETGNWPKWLSGAINAVSGTLQMAAGAALGVAAGWTGVGAVAAGFLMLNGSATAAQGVGQIVNAVTGSNVLREDNIVRSAVVDVGQTIAGNTGAIVAGVVYDATVLATSAYAATVSKPSACFIAGTAILTAVGSKAIEEITPGDLVWAENTETGEKSLKKVVQTFVRESNELVHIYVNGEKITTTPEHPFYVPKQGWTTAIQLRAGDILVLQSGKYVVVEKIQHEILETPVTVYNFEVEDFHTYYVGDNGVLVHNTCKVHTSDQQAVIQLAKEYKNGISKSDADILVGWAKEYGLNAHGTMIHPNRSGIWSFTEHIKIFKEHIPVK